MADNLNTRAIVYDMLMSIEKEIYTFSYSVIPDTDEIPVFG